MQDKDERMIEVYARSGTGWISAPVQEKYVKEMFFRALACRLSEAPSYLPAAEKSEQQEKIVKDVEANEWVTLRLKLCDPKELAKFHGSSDQESLVKRVIERLEPEACQIRGLWYALEGALDDTSRELGRIIPSILEITKSSGGRAYPLKQEK